MVINPKLICIIGRTCTGKDTLAHVLENYAGIKPLISYTTRPKRDHETHGKEHYFITEQDYKDRFKNREKLAYTKINGYHYFTLYGQLTEDGMPIHSYIIDPTGYYMLKKEFGTKIGIRTIYVRCSKETQFARYNNREKKISVPFSMRDAAEDEQFYLFEQNDMQDCDIIVKTDDFNLLNILNLKNI